jgi:transcriptional regulator with XRE-family HTH domain
MTNQEILNKIIGLVGRDKVSDQDKAEIGTLIQAFREGLSLTPKEFAQQLGVSVQTLHRWEKMARPPRMAQVRKFELLLAETEKRASGAAGEAKMYVQLDSQYLAVRPLPYILLRERDANQVYLFKSIRPFLAGWPGQPRQEMLAIMEERFNARKASEFYFVFTKYPGVARKTFTSFKESLESDREYRKMNLNIKGYCIDDANVALGLGLSPTFAAWVVIVYDDLAKKALKREFDIFAELPVALLADPENNVWKHGAEDVWVELPQQHADLLWRRWRPILEQWNSEKGPCDLKMLKEMERADSKLESSSLIEAPTILG